MILSTPRSDIDGSFSAWLLLLPLLLLPEELLLLLLVFLAVLGVPAACAAEVLVVLAAGSAVLSLVCSSERFPALIRTTVSVFACA
jgi:hypothetical protein